MTEQELKELEKSLAPCPCCGGHAHIHTSLRDGYGFVVCGNTWECGLTNRLDKIETAVKRWNRRVA